MPGQDPASVARRPIVFPEYDLVAVFTGWNVLPDRPALSRQAALEQVLGRAGQALLRSLEEPQMNEPAASALADALRDRYRVERELGQGGMATVYLARDLKHDRPVAIKVLRPDLAVVLGGKRFLREIAQGAGRGDVAAGRDRCRPPAGGDGGRLDCRADCQWAVATGLGGGRAVGGLAANDDGGAAELLAVYEELPRRPGQTRGRPVGSGLSRRSTPTGDFPSSRTIRVGSTV